MKKKQVIKLNESQLRQIVKESVNNMLYEGIYSEDEEYKIANMLFDYAMDAIESLGSKANIIAYILSPETTAIGAGFSYNRQTFEDLLWPQCLHIVRYTPKDGNRDFTLKQVISRIKSNKD